MIGATILARIGVMTSEEIEEIEEKIDALWAKQQEVEESLLDHYCAKEQAPPRLQAQKMRLIRRRARLEALLP